MRTATLYRYELAMDSMVILRNQRLKSREGLLVKLTEGEQTGWGEIAPLPEFSHESLDEALAQALPWVQAWQNGEAVASVESLYPSVAFGLSMAQLELTSALPAEGDYRVAPLCSGDPDELVVTLAQQAGDKVAKIKVGLYEAVRDGMVANMFVDAIPDIRLRLDANRQWTPLKAQQFAKYVKPENRHGIAFLEEPCQTPEQSLAFAAETGIAIAWDETLRDEGFELSAEPGLAAIVIKPTLMGSVQKCIALIEKAHELKLETVISSSLESSLGLNQLARFAKWKTPESIPGLDTMQLFMEQVEPVWPGSSLPVKHAMQIVWQSA
ncbi:o-succinylbenzoate synthase [Thaumasiovibrio subtropicus]|uniref:o-succinylbenzoate synthase n=1 Tax=Thaumasiovibrio subtropicus TaxID=1891207 RepID=UPI000B3594A0|nr:o-succinylbenzoate synthase [Thaumasiovibrio subtropicus]